MTCFGEAVYIWQQIADGIALVGHGLEFRNFEYFTMLAGALLEEESAGAFVGKMQPRRDGSQWYRKYKQCYTGGHDVDCTFEKALIWFHWAVFLCSIL